MELIVVGLTLFFSFFFLLFQFSLLCLVGLWMCIYRLSDVIENIIYYIPVLMELHRTYTEVNWSDHYITDFYWPSKHTIFQWQYILNNHPFRCHLGMRIQEFDRCESTHFRQSSTTCGIRFRKLQKMRRVFMCKSFCEYLVKITKGRYLASKYNYCCYYINTIFFLFYLINLFYICANIYLYR